MKNKTLAAIFLLTTLASPVIANASSNDFIIINNTELYGSISLKYSPCSSNVGSDGIVKPHESHVFSHAMVSMFCGSSCTIYLYPNDNCKGSALGTAAVSSKDGITSYTNNDPEHYTVTGSGFDFTIDPVSKGFKSWLSRLFS